MKKQLITALSVALLTATSGSVMAAQPDAREGHERHDRQLRLHRGGMHEAGDPQAMIRHLSRTLELDQTQQQKIENILSAAKPEMDDLRERAEANRKAMHELDVSDSSHGAKLDNLAAEKGAIVSEQAVLHGRLKADIHAVLTPEQRQELAGKSAKRRDRFQKRKGVDPRN